MISRLCAFEARHDNDGECPVCLGVGVVLAAACVVLVFIVCRRLG